MYRAVKKTIAFILAILLSTAMFAQQSTPDRFQKIAGRIVESFNAGDFKGVQSDFSRAMLDAVPLEKLSQVSRELVSQFGRIQKLDPPRLTSPNTAIFTTRFERGVLDMIIALDAQDKIIGLQFVPHMPTAPAPERNSTTLSLPFKDAWSVAWGGDTRELNYHNDTPNQRFAFDFVVVDGSGKTFKGKGARNEDYYAFGREVLAPGDGIVTDVISGVRDNTPGSMNPYSGLGNAVFIQHGEQEVSVLAHLKLGSMRVKVGDKVQRGQVIGLCGNSGNSSEPHLHYHLQNSILIQDAVGIKCYFQIATVMKEGKKEKKMNYSPVRGEIVSSE